MTSYTYDHIRKLLLFSDSPETRFDDVCRSCALRVVVKVGKVGLGGRKVGVHQLRQEGAIRERGVVVR